MLNSNLRDQVIQAFCAEKSSKFDHTTCQTWQRQKCSETGHQPRKTFEGLERQTQKEGLQVRHISKVIDKVGVGDA